MGTKTPEPAWHRIRQDGNMEIRDYDRMTVAEVMITGERYMAINAGFRILASYISGDNRARKKIPMTAPVIQEAGDADGEAITMMAPVIQEPGETMNTWNIRFVMPPEYTPALLPVPEDTRIRFLEVPAYRTAVIQFSGFNTDSNLSEHLSILMDWLASNNISPAGRAIYAFYNPPWTLPFFRRNEISIRIPG